MASINLKSVKLSNGETLGLREREGGEQVVLLIHGNMTSSKHWDLLLESMSPEYKLYAVDMRGFGISTYLEPVNSIKDFADDIKLLVDELGLKDFTIMGWSTGGAVGMQFVADNPDYCNKLILLASASTRGYPFFDLGENGQVDFTKRLVSKEDISRDKARSIPVQNAYDTNDKAFLKALWNMMIYRRNQPNEAKYDEYVEDMLTQRNLVDVYYSLNTFNISNHHNGLNGGSGGVDNIEIPVLVLRGDEDLVITETMAKEIVEDLGEYATFVELKECGHSPLMDNLDQLLVVISEFLEEKELAK